MAHTYEQLASAEAERSRRRYRLSRRIQRLFIGAACLLLACGLVVGSGFMSPAMAESLRHIPLLDRLYEKFGDPGLAAAERNGMVAPESYTQTKAGRTVTVSNFMYDGARVSFAVKIHAEDRKLQDYEYGTFGVSADVNGEDGPYSFSSRGAERLDDSTALKIIDMGHSGYDGRTGKAYAFPAEFELSLKVAIFPLKGVDNGIYAFTVPIVKNTPSATVLASDEVKTYEGITYQVERLEITPATTHLVTLQGIPANMSEELPQKLKEHRSLSAALFDENGREIKDLGSSGTTRIGDQDLFRGMQDFEPLSPLPKSITVKPYAGYKKLADGQVVPNYIEELELTIELP